jgi:hypothetical protein
VNRHETMEGSDMKPTTEQTLAAREREARLALSRLRTCGRKIEHISAVAGATRVGPGTDRMRRRLRAVSIEAARLRVELRNWNVGSSRWIYRVNDRLSRLEGEIEIVPSSGSLRLDTWHPFAAQDGEWRT